MFVPIMLMLDLYMSRDDSQQLFRTPPARSNWCRIEQTQQTLRARLTHAEQALRDHPDRASQLLIKRLNDQIDHLDSQRDAV